MCTVSWTRQDGGYRLFCNRDEKHTRRIALPPAVRERRGVRFIAPLARRLRRDMDWCESVRSLFVFVESLSNGIGKD